MLVSSPELWFCQQCDWVGVIPTVYARQHFDSVCLNSDGNIIPVEFEPEWPTCPKCSGHRFKVQDVTVQENFLEKDC